MVHSPHPQLGAGIYLGLVLIPGGRGAFISKANRIFPLVDIFCNMCDENKHAPFAKQPFEKAIVKPSHVINPVDGQLDTRQLDTQDD